MQFLILGGTGYLSSVLVQSSLEAGHEVTILTRGQKSTVAAGVQTLIADRKDPESVREALGGKEVDAVIDSICYHPGEAQSAVELFAGRTGRYVMISTDFVYGVKNRPIPTPETAPRDTPNPYGRSKAAAEDVFLAGNERLPVTILRPPHIVGGEGLLGTGSLEGRDATLTARLQAGDPVILLDGGALLIQPADRRDIAAAALAAIEAPKASGQVYNVAGPQAVTSLRYYEIIAGILGTTLNTLSLPSSIYRGAYPDRAVFALHRCYETSRLTADTGWLAATPLETSLNEMVESRLRAAEPMRPKSREITALAKALTTPEHAINSLLANLH
jgi:nucleoside-diphosphate-sugar epimerase